MAKAVSKNSPKVPSDDFADFLVQKNFISKERIDILKAEKESLHKPFVDIVNASGILPEEKVYKAYADFLGLPLKAISGDANVPHDLFKIIPEEAAERYGFVPLNKDGIFLDVGMLRPDDLASQDALHFIAARQGLTTRIVLITPSAFRAIFKNYKSFRAEMSSVLKELEQNLSEQESGSVRIGPVKKTEVYGEAPVIKIVAVILRQAVEGGASDIHIEPTKDQVRVRFRVDGVLYTSLFLPIAVHDAIISRFKILSLLKIDETRLSQDGRFHATISGKEIDLRVATLPTAFGEKISIRVLDPSSGLVDMQHLGLVGQALHSLQEAVARPFGMILITGPTGSGKSTTLYAVLKKINTDSVNIVTLEDPVEYYIDGVNQSQINDDIGYTFTSGLRHILRGDPNIIMVGEIRDTDTAELAVHAGLTGHLVLSTLHTNNAIGAIPRLVDLGVDAFLLPSSLVLVIAQRLVQLLCPSCKKPRDPLAEERRIIEQELRSVPKEELDSYPKEIKIWEAQGCDVCHGRGVKGRIAVFEVFRMTRELGEIIITSLTENKLQDEAKRQQMVSMFQDGLRKVLTGQIGFEELLRVVEEKEEVV